MARDQVDVVVVGSGAGGGPVALALARAGASVVVMEKGRAPEQKELIHDEILMCRRNFFIPYLTEEPHVLRYGEKDKGLKTNEFWTANVVGGGTVHMSGYFLRMKPVDMKLRSTLGPVEGANLSDWPIDYAAIEPFYAEAERELGVSGVWKSHPFEEPRSADYPMPPLLEHPLSGRIDEAAKNLGYHSFPTPRGIASRSYRGRSPCSYCALCGSYGCEMGAKGSTAVTLLPQAVATGRCQVHPQAMATEIPVDKAGRATGVVYRDSTGASHFQPARCVVVACTAVESARLLLSSRSSRFPQGLANGTGLVGKNLVLSGFGRGRALFKWKGRPERDWVTDDSPFVQRSLQDFYLLDTPHNGVRKAGTILFSLAHPNPIHTAEHTVGGTQDAVWGKALKQKLREEVAGAKRLDFEVFAEFLPAGSYVDLSPDVKDKWGMPVARVTMKRHPLDIPASKFLVEKGMEVLKALEPDSTEVLANRGETKILQGGTCRFGSDPATSVLDASCRSHEVSNLYVSDGSFLPNAGSVPFTLTIAANAFRVGSLMAKRFKARQL